MRGLLSWLVLNARSKLLTLPIALVLSEVTGVEAVGQLQHKADEQVEDFTGHGLPSWMTLDGELRGRTEAQTALNLRPGLDETYELSRVRGGIEVRAPRWFSAYAQFQDAHALALPLAETAANMRDTFDLRQGFLHFAAERMQVFAGRQELRFGEERLIGISNWTNTSRTYDVIDARFGSTQNRIDLFTGSVVKVFPTSFNRPAGGFYLHGAYATLTSLLPGIRLEPFVLIKTPPVTGAVGPPAREVLLAPGLRAEGHLPLGFDYDVQGTLERGGRGQQSIHAGAAYVKAGYTAGSLPWKPHLEPEYDYATGNPGRNPARASTFDQFYPSNHDVFGLTDLFGWQNIKQRRINLDMQPSRNWYLLFQAESLHAATPKDSLYSGSGSRFIAAPGGGFRSDDIGTEVDASGRYSPAIHLSFEAGVGHFWPGALMTGSDHGAPLTLAYFQITYQFQWTGKSAHANQ